VNGEQRTLDAFVALVAKGFMLTRSPPSRCRTLNLGPDAIVFVGITDHKFLFEVFEEVLFGLITGKNQVGVIMRLFKEALGTCPS